MRTERLARLAAAASVLLALPLGAGRASATESELQSFVGVAFGSSKSAPSLSGSRLVWQDDRNGTWDVYVKDLSTGAESAVATGPSQQTNPSISGARVVWQDDRNGTWDVFMKDLASGAESIVIGGAGQQVAPSISGARVVWQDDRNGNWDVFMRDLATGLQTPIVTHPAAQTAPRIDGPLIVWEEHRRGNADIQLKDLDLGCEVVVTLDSGAQTNPTVGGGQVAFENLGDGTVRIWDYASTVETAVAPGAGAQRGPAIAGGIVTWFESGQTGWAVRARPLAGGAVVGIASSPTGEGRVAASGARIAWLDARGSGQDLWWSDLGAPTVTSSRPRAGATYVQDVQGPTAGVIPGQPALVAGTVFTLEAAAGDLDSGIDTVEFVVDAQRVCLVESAPYRCAWPVTPGTHGIAMVARDRAGNTAVASTAIVAV